MSKSFVKFVDVTAGLDHQRHLVLNARCGETLGVIQWDRPWAQYVLLAEPHTIWSAGCLADVERFMRGLSAPQRGESCPRP
jgi:hypothetical protein